jgi:hypothetical protein
VNIAKVDVTKNQKLGSRFGVRVSWLLMWSVLFGFPGNYLG